MSTAETRDATPPPGRASGDQRLAWARKWGRLVDRARTLDGFADFLRPPRLASLLPAAERGPVIVVNVSRWRCDALVIRPDGVTTVPLGSLTLDDVDAWVTEYLDVLSVAEQAGLSTMVDACNRAEEMLADLQGWMWDVIAEPVLEELGHDRTPDGDPAVWPRVWWCPTGPLALLPLHSAGYHCDTGGSAGRTVFDRVVSSYAPTLRALVDARRPDDRPPGDLGRRGGDVDRLLLVEAHDVPDEAPIPGSDVSAILLDAFQGDRITAPRADEISPARILSQLPGHRWVHFSCHGDQDLENPSQGGLLLHGGTLTVADISARRFRGDFAGLSACKTAIGGTRLPDELITLATALHYAGYRHVVGTLWSVDAEKSGEVFTDLYGDIVRAGRLAPDLAPAALHRAVRRQRDAKPQLPTWWTPFVHIGP